MEKAFADIKEKFESIFEQTSKVIIGQRDVIKQIVIAMLCDSNALLEGYPGLAKTLSVKTLAQLMDMKFSRIQGTPDLMPSDIIGTYVLEDHDGKREFRFQPGPIFANIVLFDEVNRATPKCQSAVLEAMQEKQVTAGNKTFKLDRPFFVLATQNPIEQEGSLVSDQYVFTNFGLLNGNQLYKKCIEGGNLIQAGNMRLFDIKDLHTLSLDEDGKLQTARCFPYFNNYDGEVVKIKTKNNREIEVTSNHPFLVYRDGRVFWKKASLLDKNDLLISPKRLDILDNKIELKDHSECLDLLSKDFNIVRYEELIELREKTNNFSNFDFVGGKDFDKLRIASYLSIKELALKLEFERKHYWQLIRFLRKGTKNILLKNKLSCFFRKNKLRIREIKDYFESYKINSIKRVNFDSDLAFWLAYILSDGRFYNSNICAYQKNYPKSLDYFIKITKEKLGIRIASITADGGCRTVRIDSKPIVRYFGLRFGIQEGSGRNRPPIPGHFVLLKNKDKKTFLRTFISLESRRDPNRKKISTAQGNKQTLNVLSYLLLKEGIISSTVKRCDKSHTYYLNIQGRDFNSFLKKIGWIDNSIIKSRSPDKYSESRLIPINKEDLVGFVELLGLNSFHTLKNREKLTKKDWYCAYLAAKQGKLMISDVLYQRLIEGFKKELLMRENIVLEDSVLKDPRRTASMCGLSIGEIASELQISHSTVWALYSDGYCRSKEQIETTIINEFKKRIDVARQLLNKIEGFLCDDICYEKIKCISHRKYKGIVFGLTTPEFKNYVGGFGACGINHNTFGLPEAQSDRFLFKIKTDYPTPEEEFDIINRYTDILKDLQLKPIITKDALFKLQDIVRKVPVANDIKKIVIDLVNRSRKNKELIEYGASPRASIGLILAAKANALINGRNYVTKEDIFEMAFPILRHRIILNFEAERNNFIEDDVIKYLLK